MYWISKEWVILLCRIWPTLMFLILQKIVFWFWRKSFSDFEENRFMIFSRFFPVFEENRFLIYKKIVSDFFTILFRFWRKSFFDFGENRFLIFFSWFLETRFIELICIRKNTEKIVHNIFGLGYIYRKTSQCCVYRYAQQRLKFYVKWWRMMLTNQKSVVPRSNLLTFIFNTKQNRERT